MHPKLRDSRRTFSLLLLIVAVTSLLSHVNYIDAQQYTTTVTLGSQTFGCDGGSCSLFGVQTVTVPGVTTTYTLVQGGETSIITFIQEGTTWTNTVGITVTQPTTLVNTRTCIDCSSPPPASFVWLLAFVALVLVGIGVYWHRSSRTPRNCPHCGFKNPPFAKAYCVKCGSSLATLDSKANEHS